jgi:hypothetical protein
MTRPRLHTYRVGLGLEERQVQAPSALAAAIFYGFHAAPFESRFLAAVHEQDGKPWKGVASWMGWAFGEEQDQAAQEQLGRELPFCRFVPAPAPPFTPCPRGCPVPHHHHQEAA